MDRNAKKPKATHVDAHPERSDTKTQTRDASGRAADDARAQAAGAGAERPAVKGGRPGRRP